MESSGLTLDLCPSRNGGVSTGALAATPPHGKRHFFASSHDPGSDPFLVAELIQAGKRKQALMKYRELTGIDMGHARKVIDGL
jgi:hypothetical protein